MDGRSTKICPTRTTLFVMSISLIEQKNNKLKIGFNCSSFDMLHPGHITMLKMEKQLCDYLIVGLQVDPTIDRPGIKNKPVQSVYERYVQLQGCKYVDEILVYETEFDLLQLLKTQMIHIRFLGDEYRSRDFTGKEYCLNNDIELYYHVRQHIYSSTELRERVTRLENLKIKDKSVSLPQHSSDLINSKLFDNK
jgi:glycerol-3-phosphate cytidylyltransferase